MRLLLPIVLLTLASCAHYSAPQAVKPVRRAISVAAGKVDSASNHAKRLTEVIETIPETPELHDLRIKAKIEIDALTQDLLDATAALKDAQDKVDTLETKISKFVKLLSDLQRRYGKIKFALATLAAAATGYWLWTVRGLFIFAGPYIWGILAGCPVAVFALIYFGLDLVL